MHTNQAKPSPILDEQTFKPQQPEHTTMKPAQIIQTIQRQQTKYTPQQIAKHLALRATKKNIEDAIRLWANPKDSTGGTLQATLNTIEDNHHCDLPRKLLAEIRRNENQHKNGLNDQSIADANWLLERYPEATKEIVVRAFKANPIIKYEWERDAVQNILRWL